MIKVLEIIVINHTKRSQYASKNYTRNPFTILL